MNTPFSNEPTACTSSSSTGTRRPYRWSRGFGSVNTISKCCRATGCLYTDGVAEAKNSERELFGTDRLLEVLNSDQNASPQQVLENVTNGIDAFVGDAEQFDDITMLGFVYCGPDGGNTDQS